MGRVHKRIRYFEMIDIYGPMEDRQEWLNWLYNKGYRVLRTGPKTTSSPNVDMRRFHTVGQREIKKAPKK